MISPSDHGVECLSVAAIKAVSFFFHSANHALGILTLHSCVVIINPWAVITIYHMFFSRTTPISTRGCAPFTWRPSPSRQLQSRTFANLNGDVDARHMLGEHDDGDDDDLQGPVML